MKDETYSSAQYNEKPSDWQNAPNGPPSGASDPKVTKLSLIPRDGFRGIREDIIEFTALALKCEAFSVEKLQYQRLLAEICNSDAPDELRQEAMRSLLTTSDWGFMEDIPDYKKVIMDSVGIEKT
tara:strand:- start:26 stop:400 length:375 start_codon:yes stop_codon:yes gene_type:complete